MALLTAGFTLATDRPTFMALSKLRFLSCLEQQYALLNLSVIDVTVWCTLPGKGVSLVGI